MRSKRIKRRREQNGCVVCVYLRVCACLIMYIYMSLCVLECVAIIFPLFVLASVTKIVMKRT